MAYTAVFDQNNDETRIPPLSPLSDGRRADMRDASGGASYQTVDLLKFFFAIVIVALHSRIVDERNSLFEYLIGSVLLRMAVPFFFVTSGFFYGQKLFRLRSSGRGAVISHAKKYCIRLLPPLLLYSGICVVLEAVFVIIQHGMSLSSLIAIGTIFLRNLFYPQNAMWYLWASVLGIIIVTVIFSCCRHPKAVWLIYSVITFSFVSLCNNYYFLLGDSVLADAARIYCRIFITARNGIFLSPVYLGIGFLVAEGGVQRLIRRHRVSVLVLTVAAFGLLTLEALLLRGLPFLDDRSVYLSHIPAAPLLLCTGLVYTVPWKLPYTTLRRLSTSIYYIHATILRFLLPPIAIYLPILRHHFVEFAATLLISIAFSLFTYTWKTKRFRSIFG